MTFQNVTLKAGSMRKAKDFTVYPNGTSTDLILLQTDGRFASLHKQTGEFRITPAIKGSYTTFVHLQALGQPAEISDADKLAIRRAYNAAGNGSNGITRIL
ncbi:hypothetical protein ACP26L_36590 (plasmid) [Paenibacillus sp. S-38]|uniref:hypothetical protein n=1 Tax=Paenibacillus sp. S-38 TaxID=3416710 RepID=UPI003CE83AD6